MAEKTMIGWCDSTFNPWIGCTKISEGCKFCYAEAQNKRWGWVDAWGPSGTRRRTSAAKWDEVAHWNKQAWVECTLCGWRGWEGDKQKCKCVAPFVDARRRVFCASLADVFEENNQVEEWREMLFGLMERTNNLDWLVLTKRPENVERMVPWEVWPLNVWLGTTVENQAQVKRLIPLLDIPAPVHFVSVEPMLEQVYLGFPAWPNPDRDTWVICGGESGAGCRPMELWWAQDLYDQCQKANVPFFMKQLGGHPNKRHELTDFPEQLRVREFPTPPPTPLHLEERQMERGEDGKEG